MRCAHACGLRVACARHVYACGLRVACVWLACDLRVTCVCVCAVECDDEATRQWFGTGEMRSVILTRR